MKFSCLNGVWYDVPLLQDDPVKPQMLSFMMSSSNQQDIASLDTKVFYYVKLAIVNDLYQEHTIQL